MQSTYQVQKDGESLVAKLIEDGKRKIELTYKNARGDTQVGVYENKARVSTKVKLVCPIMLTSEGDTFLPGYLVAYNKLGPELREKIPKDWHDVLGVWLLPRKEIYPQR